MTLTISAPSIGVYCQTTITSSTPRKSAPTSAPKTRARQRLAGAVRRREGRHPSSATGLSSVRSAATMPPMANGACTTKIARQSNSCVSTPPSAGPSAAPYVPASVHVPAEMNESAPASNSPAPAPCTQRAAIRKPRLCADAQAIVATRKTSAPRHGNGGVVRRNHPRDTGDRRLEARVELRQRENDDRRVRESNRDDRRDEPLDDRCSHRKTLRLGSDPKGSDPEGV